MQNNSRMLKNLADLIYTMAYLHTGYSDAHADFLLALKVHTRFTVVLKHYFLFYYILAVLGF